MKTLFLFVCLLGAGAMLGSVGRAGPELYILLKPGLMERPAMGVSAASLKSAFCRILPRLDTSELTEMQALSRIASGRFPDLYKLRFANPERAAQAFKILQSSGMCEFVEWTPNYAFSFTPNDYNAGKQYALAKVSALQAWDLSRGSPVVVLAIVDDAVDSSHADLRPQLWRNWKDQPGNGIDDDGNGYTDDRFGWDAADGDNNPNPPASASATHFHHGTHCAGIAAAATHNARGIASLGFNLQIMPVKIAADATHSIQNAFEGVEYAILSGAHVISMSWGGSAYSQAMQMLFDYAYSRNIVCVAAAGNDGLQGKKYPAAYNHVVAVGSTDPSDRKSSFSNFGTWIDVCAPGSDIYSSLPGSAYGLLSGTSMACPLVAGLCGLMKSYSPDAVADEIESCLKSGCDNIDAQNAPLSGLLGAGRINAYRSLLCLKTLHAQIGMVQRSVCLGTALQYRDSSRGNVLVRTWRFPGGTPSVSSLPNPVVNYAAEGRYDAELIVFDGVRYDTMRLLQQVWVYRPSVRFEGRRQLIPGTQSYFTARFTGLPPFRLVYTDGNTYDTLSGITDTVLDIVKFVDRDVQYWPILFSDNNCLGTSIDTAKFIVYKNLNNDSSNCKNSNSFSLVIGSQNIDYGRKCFEFGYDRVLFVTTSDSIGVSRVCVSVIDKFGKILKSKQYNTSNGGEEIYGGYKFSNGILLTGSTRNGSLGNTDGLVIMLDTNLNILWSKVYGGKGLDIIHGCASLYHDKFVLYGSSSSKGAGAEDCFVIKIDNIGNLLWSRFIGDVGFNASYGGLMLPSGNVIISGSKTQGTNYIPIWTMFDNNGQIKFVKDINANWHTGGSKMIFHNGFLYSLVRFRINGSSDMDVVLVKSDTLMINVYWARRIESLFNDEPTNLIIDKNENLVVTGYTQNSIRGKVDYFIAKYTLNGTLIKSILFGTVNDDYISDLCLLGNGDIITIGYTNNKYLANNTNFDAIVQRYDCDLSNCLLFEDSYKKTNYSLSFRDNNMSVDSNTLSANIGFIENDFSLRSKFICADTLPPPELKCRLKAGFSFDRACAGSSTQFTDQSLDSNGYSIRSRRWLFDNEAVEGPASVPHVFQTPGMHSVSLVVYSGDTMLCSDIHTAQIWVSDSMVLRAFNDTFFCLNDSARLGLAAMHCGTAPFTYTWTPSAGISDAASASPKAAPAASTLYTVVVRDAAGKTATASMRVGPDGFCCRSYAEIQVPDAELCLGQAALFQNQSRNSGAVQYRWRFMPDGIPGLSALKDPGPVYFTGSGQKTITLMTEDACGSDSAIIYIGVNELPRVFAGRDTAVCLNTPLQLGEKGIAGLDYSWTPAQYLSNDRVPDPVCIPAAPISYVLKARDMYTACENSDTVYIGKTAVPSVRGLPDTVKCEGMPLNLEYKALSGIQYRWPDETASSPKVFTAAGRYWLRAYTGCSDTIVYFNIRDTACDCAVYFPEVFTPNGDNTNDGFQAYTSCELSHYRIMVFNRWGEIIWTAFEPGTAWDGKYQGETVSDGLYYYVVSYRKKVLNLSRFEQKKGFVSLLR